MCLQIKSLCFPNTGTILTKGVRVEHMQKRIFVRIIPTVVLRNITVEAGKMVMVQKDA